MPRLRSLFAWLIAAALLAAGPLALAEQKFINILTGGQSGVYYPLGAALSQIQVAGSPDEQALALRDAMRVLFHEAVALVSAARQGFMREHS